MLAMQMNLNMLLIALAISTFGFISPLHSQDDWSGWRGPHGNGIAAEGQTPPTTWDEDTNVVWKTKVPGRGHASPIVIGNKIFLATAEEENQSQSVICFDRKTGERLWQTGINEGALNPRIHGNNTHASPTIASDGQLVFAVFNNNDSIQVAAVDFAGTIIWKKVVGEFKSRLPFGFAASPIVYNGKVIVTNQNTADSAIVAFDVPLASRFGRSICPKPETTQRPWSPKWPASHSC